MYQRRSPFPSVTSTSAKLALALVAGSLLFAFTRGSWGAMLVLVPGAVLHGQLWQLLSYAFIDTTAFGVIIDAFVIWSIGSGLELSWGPKRLVGFTVGTTVAAAVVTVLLSLLPFLHLLQRVPFAGGMVMVTALWVGYGLSFGRAQTNFFGMPITGNTFAWIGIGFVVLDAAFSPSWLVVVPEAIGILLTFGLFRVGSPRTAWLRFSSWRLQRQLKSRSRHLKVVGKDRNQDSGSDRYLH